MSECWMIRCFSLLFLIECFSICYGNAQCNYLVKKSDNSSDECFADQCSKYVDLLSIMVEPRTCKSSFLLLSFSSYQNFVKFRNRLEWKIGDLFLSQSRNLNRQLILFIDQLDFNDRPFDRSELIHLGINIDQYILYIRNIQNKEYLQDSIHYDTNNPQWNIIKIKFRCLQLSAFDRYPCSSEIISPSLFAPQRPSTRIRLITIETLNSTEEYRIKSNEEKRKSIDFILIIIIPLIILFITMVLFILIYLYIIKKYCYQQEIISTSQSPSGTTTPNDLITKNQNYKGNENCYFRISSSSSPSDNTIVLEDPLNVNDLQKHPISRQFHVHPKSYSTKNLENNYEKVTHDNISVIGQQCFVPISSSIHF